MDAVAVLALVAIAALLAIPRLRNVGMIALGCAFATSAWLAGLATFRYQVPAPWAWVSAVSLGMSLALARTASRSMWAAWFAFGALPLLVTAEIAKPRPTKVPRLEVRISRERLTRGLGEDASVRVVFGSPNSLLCVQRLPSLLAPRSPDERIVLRFAPYTGSKEEIVLGGLMALAQSRDRIQARNAILTLRKEVERVGEARRSLALSQAEMEEARRQAEEDASLAREIHVDRLPFVLTCPPHQPCAVE